MFPIQKINGIPKKWEELYQDMEEKISIAKEETTDQMAIIRRSLNVCRAVVDLLKSHIITYTFQSSEEEIFFFKEVKPAFYSHLIYYMKLFDLETRRPAGSSKLTEVFLNRALDKLKYFYDSNIDFYQYYRSGATYLDDSYFKRGKQDLYLNLDDDYYSYDTSFSTIHDLKVARILANERLHIYISNCIKELRSDSIMNNESSRVKSVLHWTATKAGLIELLYALQSTGTFNSGASDLKQLASYFEQAFDIKLGNYYNVFQEMRIRKKNRTSFLDQLKERLIKRMDEADENM